MAGHFGCAGSSGLKVTKISTNGRGFTHSSKSTSMMCGFCGPWSCKWCHKHQPLCWPLACKYPLTGTDWKAQGNSRDSSVSRESSLNACWKVLPSFLAQNADSWRPQWETRHHWHPKAFLTGIQCLKLSFTIFFRAKRGRSAITKTKTSNPNFQRYEDAFGSQLPVFPWRQAWSPDRVVWRKFLSKTQISRAQSKRHRTRRTLR